MINSPVRRAQSCRDQTFAGKWLIDVRASWAFTDSVELTVGADNVFDTTPDEQTSETKLQRHLPVQPAHDAVRVQRRLLLCVTEHELRHGAVRRQRDRPSCTSGAAGFFLLVPDVYFSDSPVGAAFSRD